MSIIQNIISQAFLIFFGLMILCFKRESRAAKALIYLGTILLIISASFLVNISVVAYTSNESVYMYLTYAAGAVLAFTVLLRALGRISFKKMFAFLGIEAVIIALIVVFLFGVHY